MQPEFNPTTVATKCGSRSRVPDSIGGPMLGRFQNKISFENAGDFCGELATVLLDGHHSSVFVLEHLKVQKTCNLFGYRFAIPKQIFFDMDGDSRGDMPHFNGSANSFFARTTFDSLFKSISFFKLLSMRNKNSRFRT